ncbi:MAG: hypothetical protein RL375_412 [Pseudomonadota bacterium]|jgi:hypothetical protein
MSPMQRALGRDWDRLPPALQAHHRAAPSTDKGELEIDFPTAMQPWLHLIAAIGALVSRKGRHVRTTVDKQMDGERQHWRRTMRYADGRVFRFDSVWVPSTPGRFIEYVNPWLGLEMEPSVRGQQIHCRGTRFILRLGGRMLTLPQWLGPGVTGFVEAALDEQRFAMDFRMTHPWFGQLFRYSGTFQSCRPD